MADLSVPLILVLLASLAATLFLWRRLVTWEAPRFLKGVLAIVALFPVVGPILTLWVIAMPDRLPERLRATMNHYGQGGRFSGFGSRRFGPDDISDNGADWRPTVEELKKQRPKRRSR